MIRLGMEARRLTIEHKYFLKGCVPLIRVQSVFDLIENRFDAGDNELLKMFGASHEYQRIVNKLLVVPAELELLDLLIRRETYGSMLDDPLEVWQLVPKTRTQAKITYPLAFECERQLKRTALFFGVAPWNWESERAVWNCRIVSLMNLVQKFGTMPVLEEFPYWNDSAWDEYFEEHPTHEVVLPIRRAINNCQTLCSPDEWGSMRERCFGPVLETLVQEENDDQTETPHW